MAGRLRGYRIMENREEISSSIFGIQDGIWIGEERPNSVEKRVVYAELELEEVDIKGDNIMTGRCSRDRPRDLWVLCARSPPIHKASPAIPALAREWPIDVVTMSNLILVDFR
jgi:hypothetical protein